MRSHRKILNPDSRDDGHHALQLHFGGQTCGVGSRALAAHVDDVDARCHHLPGPPDGRLHLQLRMCIRGVQG